MWYIWLTNIKMRLKLHRSWVRLKSHLAHSTWVGLKLHHLDVMDFILAHFFLARGTYSATNVCGQKKKLYGATTGMWSIVNTYIWLYWFPYEHQRQNKTHWTAVTDSQQPLIQWRKQILSKANMAQPPDFWKRSTKKDDPHLWFEDT